MKTSNGSPRRWRRRIQADRRAQLLVAFDRSGLSAAAFARQHGLNYTTFKGCGFSCRTGIVQRRFELFLGQTAELAS